MLPNFVKLFFFCIYYIFYAMVHFYQKWPECEDGAVVKYLLNS